VDPVPDPLLLRKSGSGGNQTWESGCVARNSDYYTTEAVFIIIINIIIKNVKCKNVKQVVEAYRLVRC
jgi:hypothetical protein